MNSTSFTTPTSKVWHSIPTLMNTCPLSDRPMKRSLSVPFTTSTKWKDRQRVLRSSMDAGGPQKNGCDAVLPGWGFVSEDPFICSVVEENNIVFLGPSSAAMGQLGDKIAAKYLAEKAGVPLAPWAEYQSDWTETELIQTGDAIGYPLMVKASAGGGGRGIRKVKGASRSCFYDRSCAN